MNSMNTVQVNSIYSIYLEYPLTTAKQTLDSSPGDVSEEPVTQEERKKDWRMNCDVGELRSFFNLSITSPMSQLFLQPFPRFTYVTANSPTLPLLHLRHFILQPFFRFSCVTSSSLNSPDEPAINKIQLFHYCHQELNIELILFSDFHMVFIY